MATQRVMVKRETLEACMRCPLCKETFREATTISLCLHTFCRQCIYEKLTDGEEDSCPVCHVNLGAVPEEKLRPDHNWQELREKVFPSIARAAKSPVDVTPSTSPIKRKERSLSSLVISGPQVSKQSKVVGRRIKDIARKVKLRKSDPQIEKLPKNRDLARDCLPSSNSQEILNKSSEKKAQDQPLADCSGQRQEDKENEIEVLGRKESLWTASNCLAEAANRSKLPKGHLEGPSHASPKEPNDAKLQVSLTLNKTNAKSPTAAEGDVKREAHEEKNGDVVFLGPLKQRKSYASSGEQENVLELGATNSIRKHDVWLCLVADEGKEGASLQQIPLPYLRIKDGSASVSFVQKYLMKKLDLSDEDEVEIMCHGEPVPPMMKLHELRDLWFRTSPSSRQTPVYNGSSAKDFLMQLSYCRKEQGN